MNAVMSKRVRGIVLLDALIAVLIFSIGILGMVRLQSNAVGFASDAKYRSDAAMLADQVIGRMWAADHTTLAAVFVGDAGSGGPAYATWNSQVSDDLPAGVGSISIDAANLATVNVAWTNPSDGQSHSYISVTQVSQ